MAYISRSEICHIHIPKTGGNWVRRALSGLGPWQVEKGAFGFERGSAHGLPGRWDYPIIFAVVRHPAEWLRSAWGSRMLDKWLPYPQYCPWQTFCTLVDQYKTDDFAMFASHVATALPGVITWLFDAYTPPPVEVFRLEGEVQRFVTSIGGTPDVPRQNVGAVSDIPISDETREEIYDAEKALYEKHRYGE